MEGKGRCETAGKKLTAYKKILDLNKGGLVLLISLFSGIIHHEPNTSII